MIHVAVEMTDVAYALTGCSVPGNHAFVLWSELVRILPWLEQEEQAGMLPLRAPERGDPMVLPRRARLVLRIPASLLAEAKRLSGRVLDVGGHSLSLGAAKERPLQPHPTLHAQLVASEADEESFMSAAADELRRMEISGKLICGKRLALPGSEGGIAGYSLVVHDLKPQDSLRLQWQGLGAQRHFGCGIFIPYKVIANLE